MESCSVTVVVKELLKSSADIDAVDSVATDKQSCLVSEADRSLHIDHDHTHAYYYQVQTQLFIIYVVWTIAIFVFVLFQLELI